MLYQFKGVSILGCVNSRFCPVRMYFISNMKRSLTEFTACRCAGIRNVDAEGTKLSATLGSNLVISALLEILQEGVKSPPGKKLNGHKGSNKTQSFG